MSPPLLPRGLYALCDDTLGLALPVPEQAARLLEGGARVLQLRLKRTSMREALPLAREVVERASAHGALCLINDRVDLCLVAGAHGVHLGDEDLPVADARRVLGARAVIGATVRDAAGAQEARGQGADYVGMGPIWATTTKQVPAPVLGPAAFAAQVALSPLPVVGIGGITLARIGEVARAGAHCAAVLSDPLTADDVAARTAALCEAFAAGEGGLR